MFMEKKELSVKPNGCNLMKEACLIEPANWMTWFEGVGGSLEESKVRSLIPTNTNVNVKKQVDRSWRCLLLNIGIDELAGEFCVGFRPEPIGGGRVDGVFKKQNPFHER